MDSDLLRRAGLVWARLYTEGELTKEQVVDLLGAEATYPIVANALVSMGKAERRRGAKGGLARAAYARRDLTERDAAALREHLEQQARRSDPTSRLLRLPETRSGSIAWYRVKGVVSGAGTS